MQIRFNMIAKMCVASLVCFAYAAENNSASWIAPGEGVGYSLENADVNEGCYPSAMPRVTKALGYNLDICGKLLVWKTIQGQMNYLTVYTNTITSTGDVSSLVSSSSNYYQRCRYYPSFQLSIATPTKDDHFNFMLQFTRVHDTIKTSVDTNDLGSFAYLTPGFAYYKVVNTSVDIDGATSARTPSANARISSLTSEWRPQLDTIDFLVSKPYYFGTMLSFTPKFGLRLGFIKQLLGLDASTSNGSSTTFGDITSVNQNFNSKSWLVGFHGCCDNAWILPMGWRFMTNFGGTLFYQRLDLESSYRLNYANAGTFSLTAGQATYYQSDDSALLSTVVPTGATAATTVANVRINDREFTVGDAEYVTFDSTAMTRTSVAINTSTATALSTINEIVFTGSDEVSSSTSYRSTRIKAHLQAGIGMGWSRFFSDMACKFDFSIMYFLHYWAEQNHMPRLNMQLTDYNRNILHRKPASLYPAPLQFHGVNIAMMFSF